MIRSVKTLGLLNSTIGAHFKFEEEALFLMLDRFLGEQIDEIVQEHFEARSSARRLAEILSYDDLSKIEEVEVGWWELRSLFDHVATGFSLSIIMKRLSEEELYRLGLKFKEAKQAKVPLLDWAVKIEE